MRDLPEALEARIESGAATLCDAWIVTRADGVALGFTDHDRPLTVDGVPCRPDSGWTGGVREAAAGLTPGSGAIHGVLDDEALTDADLDAGLYDGATVDWLKVDWAEPALLVRLAVATVTRITREGDSFTAELSGPLAALEQVVGRTYGRDCDARLGDARCGVDLAAHPGATCDRRWDTCRTVFANTINFRGFPDIPGDDFLAAVPVEGGRHDGRSRR